MSRGRSVRRVIEGLLAHVPGIRVNYQTRTPLDSGLSYTIETRSLPLRLPFPAADSLFSGVPIWINEVQDCGTVLLQVVDNNLTISPGQEVRFGATLGAKGTVKVEHRSTDWEKDLRHSLDGGLPAAVWIMRNEADQSTTTETGVMAR